VQSDDATEPWLDLGARDAWVAEHRRGDLSSAARFILRPIAASGTICRQTRMRWRSAASSARSASSSAGGPTGAPPRRSAGDRRRSGRRT
jgi:hypothetical protein